MRKIAVSLIALSAAFSAAPAAAQSWHLQSSAHRQIQSDISQLDNRIARAAQRGTISQREANGLRREARQLERLYQRFSRNGLDRTEVRQLENGVNSLRQRLRLERRDWDGRRN